MYTKLAHRLDALNKTGLTDRGYLLLGIGVGCLWLGSFGLVDLYKYPHNLELDGDVCMSVSVDS